MLIEPAPLFVTIRYDKKWLACLRSWKIARLIYHTEPPTEDTCIRRHQLCPGGATWVAGRAKHDFVLVLFQFYFSRKCRIRVNVSVNTQPCSSACCTRDLCRPMYKLHGSRRRRCLVYFPRRAASRHSDRVRLVARLPVVRRVSVRPVQYSMGGTGSQPGLPLKPSRACRASTVSQWTALISIDRTRHASISVSITTSTRSISSSSSNCSGDDVGRRPATFDLWHHNIITYMKPVTHLALSTSTNKVIASTDATASPE